MVWDLVDHTGVEVRNRKRKYMGNIGWHLAMYSHPQDLADLSNLFLISHCISGIQLWKEKKKKKETGPNTPLNLCLLFTASVNFFSLETCLQGPHSLFLILSQETVGAQFSKRKSPCGGKKTWQILRLHCSTVVKQVFVNKKSPALQHLTWWWGKCSVHWDKCWECNCVNREHFFFPVETNCPCELVANNE